MSAYEQRVEPTDKSYMCVEVSASVSAGQGRVGDRKKGLAASQCCAGLTRVCMCVVSHENDCLE